jgi:hypothetical protein
MTLQLTRAYRPAATHEDLMQVTSMLRRVLLAALALTLTAVSADAACRLPGRWQMNFIQDGGGTVAATVSCEIRIASNGRVEGTCDAYQLRSSAVDRRSITGSFAVTRSCDLSGSYTPQGLPTVTIRGGFIDGGFGSAVGTRGSPFNNVRLITLMKR